MADNPDTLPTSMDMAGECPRCGRVSNFSSLVQHGLSDVVSYSRDGGRSHARCVEQVSVLKCMGCQEQVVVIEAEIGDQYGLRGVYWWPAHDLGSSRTMPGVPESVVEAYAEGSRCISVGSPNAAAAMFRTALAHVVNDKGSDTAKSNGTLFEKINQMAADGALWNDFGESAHYIRQVGNAGAHGEKFQSVSIEHAMELQQFLRELLNFIYVQPFKRRKALPPVPQAGIAPVDSGFSPTGVQPNPGGAG